jgi:hypothetical protein
MLNDSGLAFAKPSVACAKASATEREARRDKKNFYEQALKAAFLTKNKKTIENIAKQTKEIENKI